MNIVTIPSFAQKLTIGSEEMPPARVEITLEKLQNDDQLFWPMVPGDTLEKLAIRLYPNSPILQQRFILKTISLTKVLGLHIQAQSRFKAPQFIIIPNEKSVRELTRPIQRAGNIHSKQDTLKLSYGLDFSLPNYDTVEPPDTSLKLSLPNFKMPSIALPKLTLPELELPKLKMPSLNLTPLKNKVTEDWDTITQKSLLLTKNLSQQTQLLIKDYKHKSLTQIYNNYRLRNAALISILILVFAFLWIAHRRRKRSQALILNAIGGTIKTGDDIQLPIVKLPEGANGSDLVDQIDALIAQDKVAVPDVEAYEVKKDLTNVSDRNKLAADIHTSDKQPQIYE